VRPVSQGQGRRKATERWSGLVSRGTRSTADEVVPVLWYWGGLTRSPGSQGPGGRGPESSDEGLCSSLRARAGQRVRGVGRRL